MLYDPAGMIHLCEADEARYVSSSTKVLVLVGHTSPEYAMAACDMVAGPHLQQQVSQHWTGHTCMTLAHAGGLCAVAVRPLTEGLTTDLQCGPAALDIPHVVSCLQSPAGAGPKAYLPAQLQHFVGVRGLACGLVENPMMMASRT